MAFAPIIEVVDHFPIAGIVAVVLVGLAFAVFLAVCVVPNYCRYENAHRRKKQKHAASIEAQPLNGHGRWLTQHSNGIIDYQSSDDGRPGDGAPTAVRNGETPCYPRMNTEDEQYVKDSMATLELERRAMNALHERQLKESLASDHVFSKNLGKFAAQNDSWDLEIVHKMDTNEDPSFSAKIGALCAVSEDVGDEKLKHSLSIKDKVLGIMDGIPRSFGRSSRSRSGPSFNRSPRAKSPPLPFVAVPSGSPPHPFVPIDRVDDDEKSEEELSDAMDGLIDDSSSEEVAHRISDDALDVDVKQRRRDIRRGGVQQTFRTVQDRKIKAERQRVMAQLARDRVVYERVRRWERKGGLGGDDEVRPL